MVAREHAILESSGSLATPYMPVPTVLIPEVQPQSVPPAPEPKL